MTKFVSTLIRSGHSTRSGMKFSKEAVEKVLEKLKDDDSPPLLAHTGSDARLGSAVGKVTDVRVGRGSDESELVTEVEIFPHSSLVDAPKPLVDLLELNPRGVIRKSREWEGGVLEVEEFDIESIGISSKDPAKPTEE